MQRFSNTRFRWMVLSCLTAGLALSSGCRQQNASDTAPTDSEFTTVMNVGRSQFEKGDAAAAVESFREAVSLYPTSIDARQNLANALLAAGQPEAVFEQTSQLIDMNPGQGAAYYLAGCAHNRLGQFEEALKDLQQAKAIDRTVNQVSFQLGIAHEGAGNLDEAIAQWRETIQFGPDHPAAHYRLSRVLTRTGETEEAQELLERHQDIVAGRNIPSNPSFFEQCVYTQMRVAFIVEQPDENGISVSFTDVTAEWLPNAGSFTGPAGLIDFNRNGMPGLLVLDADNQFRLLAFTNGQYAPVGGGIQANPDGGYSRILVGDLDNDRFDDAIVLGTNQSHVLKLGAGGRMTDRTLLTGLAELKAVDGQLADLDFTSKLSLLAVQPQGQGIQFHRNMGNVQFREDTAAIGLPTNSIPFDRVEIDDWNGDDLPDVFALAQNRIRMFANQRGGSFVETNMIENWPDSRAMLISDFNNDLRFDSALLTGGELQVQPGGLPDQTMSSTASENFTRLRRIDFDNDGWLDVIAFGDGGLMLWRNVGEKGFQPVAEPTGLPQTGAKEIIAADLDFDCDTDLLLVQADNSLRFLRNDGGNQNRMLKIKPVGNRSNSSGIGTRFELTAGNWRGMRVARQVPVEIGVGPRDQVDSLMAQWTQITMNIDSIATDECRVYPLIELQQEQVTSCPYLYTWDGEKFRFVSDFLAAAPVGLPVAPGRIIEADPEELLHLGDESNVKPKDGKFLLQLTEELSEMLYLDEARLVVVDHAPDIEVFSTSKMLPGRPWIPHELVALKNRIPLTSAINHHGDTVTGRLQEADQVRVSPEIFGDHLRGWAKPHHLVLEFEELDHTKPLVLALTGWLRFGGAMANIAASQRDDLPFPFPTLEVETADGNWQAVDVRVGTPAGRTKSIIVDLTGKLPPNSRRLKLGASFELHWDRIALFEKADPSAMEIARIDPTHTDFHWRGISAKADLDWTHPPTPVYEDLLEHAPFPIVPTGWATRYGEVDELIAEKDNALVLINSGDELTLEFDADQLPPKPAGMQRDYFLWSVGWDKDTDYHTVLGDQIEPWPWHGMDDQTYGEVERPEFPSDALMKRYTTRWIGPSTFEMAKDETGK